MPSAPLRGACGVLDRGSRPACYPRAIRRAPPAAACAAAWAKTLSRVICIRLADADHEL